MERYELEAWLGPALEDLSTREVDEFAAAVDEIGRAIPVPEAGEPADVAEERDAAMVAALQVQLGETTLEEVSERLMAARAEEARAMAAVKGAAIAASAAGVSTLRISQRLGVNRGTVREALGEA